MVRDVRHAAELGFSSKIVGLFISTTAYRLSLKCHCYSSLAQWETIKNTRLNPIYKLSARLCVSGKLYWVVQHIKQTKLYHLTMWPISISYHLGSLVNALYSVFTVGECEDMQCDLCVSTCRTVEKIEPIVIFQCLLETVVFSPLAVSETLQNM